MGDIISTYDCQQCGYHHAISHFYYSIQKEIQACRRCGYVIEVTPEGVKESKGYGTYTIRTELGGHTGFFTKEKAEKFHADVESKAIFDMFGPEVISITFTFLKDGKWHRGDIMCGTFKEIKDDDRLEIYNKVIQEDK